MSDAATFVKEIECEYYALMPAVWLQNYFNTIRIPKCQTIQSNNIHKNIFSLKSAEKITIFSLRRKTNIFTSLTENKSVCYNRKRFNDASDAAVFDQPSADRGIPLHVIFRHWHPRVRQVIHNCNNSLIKHPIILKADNTNQAHDNSWVLSCEQRI